MIVDKKTWVGSAGLALKVPSVWNISLVTSSGSGRKYNNVPPLHFAFEIGVS